MGAGLQAGPCRSVRTLRQIRCVDRDLEWARGRYDAWEQGIRDRDDIALGALERLLEGMARTHPTRRPTERALDCLHLLAQGCTNREVAERLGIGVETVKTHLLHARQALDAQSSTHAVAIAWRLCLID